jgi:ubiquinone/menaquinone biosynthesis C-methylase UbiE
MDAPKSYEIGWKPSHIQHHASRTAETNAQYLLPHLTKRAQLKPDLQLLDIGAGPGSISASLARYIPKGKVTATDISDDVLQQAREHARQVGCTNIEFQVADVYSLPFPDNTFDIVHVSQVLGHLNEPVKALKEMLRVCVPGGILGICEADMRSWTFYPDLPVLQDFFDLMCGLMPRRDTGLSLVSFALQAGVRRSDIQFTTSTYSHITDAERQVFGSASKERAREGNLRKKAIESGLKSAEAMDEMVKAWDLWIASEEACSACINGEIVITKTL